MADGRRLGQHSRRRRSLNLVRALLITPLQTLYSRYIGATQINMKHFTQFIKGALITAFALGLFTLNVGPLTQYSPTPQTGTTAISQETNVMDLMIPKAYAATPEVNTEKKTEDTKDPINIEEILKSVAKASTYVNKLFNPLIYYLTFQIGNFLGNDYIFGGNMGKMLHGIWVVSRNIVNIIFVLILLFLAVQHIFGGEENSDLKKTLPKFVIMLIAINFSWLAGRLVLDAANVATNVVFQIPTGVQGVIGEDVFAGTDCKLNKDKTNVEGACFPTSFHYPMDTEQVTNHTDCTKEDIEEFNKNYKEAYPANAEPVKNHVFAQQAHICWQKIELGKYNQNSASYFLSFSMARVQNLTRVNTGDKVSQMAIGTLFSLIIQIVYLIAFASLYMALIIRVAALWFLMAFSPFLVLLYYLTKDLQFQAGGVEDQFSFQAFISWAFAPAKVAAVWSVAFIMITAGQTANENVFAKLNESGVVTAKVFGVQSLFLGMDSIQQFIWLLMTIGILWIGTFAVLTKLKVGGFIFEKINDWGKDLATEVARSPKWAPVMPIYDFKEKKWRRGGLDEMAGPVKMLRQAEERYRGERGKTAKIADAGEKLKRSNAEVGVLNSSADIDKKYKAFMKGTGLDHKTIASLNEKEIGALLKGANISDHETLAGEFKKQATQERSTALPGTAPLPAATGKGLTEQDIEKGVRTALQKANIKTELQKMELTGKEANVEAKAKEIVQANPQTSHEAAVLEAIKTLGKKTPEVKPKQPDVDTGGGEGNE